MWLARRHAAHLSDRQVRLHSFARCLVRRFRECDRTIGGYGRACLSARAMIRRHIGIYANGAQLRDPPAFEHVRVAPPLVWNGMIIAVALDRTNERTL